MSPPSKITVRALEPGDAAAIHEIMNQPRAMSGVSRRQPAPAYAARLQRLRKRRRLDRGPRAEPAAEPPGDDPRLTSEQKTASEPPLCRAAVARSQRFLSL